MVRQKANRLLYSTVITVGRIDIMQLDLSWTDFTAFGGTLTPAFLKHDPSNLENEIVMVMLTARFLFLSAMYSFSSILGMDPRILLTIRQFYSWLEQLLADPTSHGIPEKYGPDVSNIRSSFLIEHQ